MVVASEVPPADLAVFLLQDLTLREEETRLLHSDQNRVQLGSRLTQP